MDEKKVERKDVLIEVPEPMRITIEADGKAISGNIKIGGK